MPETISELRKVLESFKLLFFWSGKIKSNLFVSDSLRYNGSCFFFELVSLARPSDSFSIANAGSSNYQNTQKICTELRLL